MSLFCQTSRFLAASSLGRARAAVRIAATASLLLVLVPLVAAVGAQAATLGNVNLQKRYDGQISSPDPKWTWDAVPGATKYFVWPTWPPYGERGGFGFFVYTLSYEPTNVPDGSWDIGWAACNEQGCGGSIRDRLTVVKPPAMPIWVQSYGGGSAGSNPVWRWRADDKGGPPLEYEIETDRGNYGRQSQTNFSPGFLNDGTHWISVRAINKSGTSIGLRDTVLVGGSAPTTPTPTPGPPPVQPPPGQQQVPGKPSFTKSYGSKPAELRPSWKWKPGSGGTPSGYVIKVSWKTDAIHITAAEYTADRNLDPGGFYNIEVRAENGAGTSHAISEWFSVRK